MTGDYAGLIFKAAAVVKAARMPSYLERETPDLIEKASKKKYSLRHVQRILHKLEFSRITPRAKHIKNDPVKVQAFRKNFKKNSKRSIWVAKL